jgi:hypothetical protein
MFTLSNDLDHARRLLAEVALFLTHPKCDIAAREWFLQEFERIRSEAKAQIREQKETAPLGPIFGPKRVEAPTPIAPTPIKRGRGRPRKNQTLPASLAQELFKQPPECQHQLDALFNRRPTPIAVTTSNASKPAKVNNGNEIDPMRAQLQGLFRKP